MFQYEKAWQDARARIAARRSPQALTRRDPSARGQQTHPAESVRALHALGQRAFRELLGRWPDGRACGPSVTISAAPHRAAAESNKTAAVAARFS
ncbi:MAG: hypothetical protein IPF60_10810 [Betaproteobacteria bacterium]|nr:hypothetical protein [Betaproteobacteria bacterium]